MTPLSRLSPFIAPATRSHAKFFPRGPFISVTLAQLIIESAWGTAISGRNNYFGIKANAAQLAAGHYTIRLTHETIKGQYVKVPQSFADYPDLESCFDAHATLLTTPHYARCISAPSPNLYAHALWLCGYATGIPGHPYDAELIGLMQTHNLYQYDQVPKPALGQT
jgi:flagellum-specific peptidoglycan hydrolase FlgJ